jgi:phosphoribosylformylglycinamidine cyclo-ligase
VPPIFSLLKKIGRIEVEEMHRVFNMGIGLVLVTTAGQADGVIARAAELGDKGFKIGEIVASGAGGARVEYVGADGA